MYLSPMQTLGIILAVAAGTVVTRFVPFILFSDRREPPKVIHYLSKVLPAAMMGLLVVYCLKGVSLFQGSHGIPEAIASAVTVALHLWKRQTLLSIAGGTLCYMFLVQMIF